MVSEKVLGLKKLRPFFRKYISQKDIKMGFDLCVEIQFHMDPATGEPYVWSRSVELRRLPIDLAEYRVPEKYRNYLKLRGRLLHCYIKGFDKSVFTAEADDFLEHYPSWSDVVGYMDEPDGWDYWKETEHNEFKSFLEWASTKRGFYLSWSY